MPPEVLARLFQQRSQARIIRFDEQAVTSAPAECLSKELWRKYRTPLSPADDEEFLLKLRLLTQDEDGKIYPSVSGVLLACPQPEQYLPGAFIQAVSYRGKDRNAAYQLDAKDITGPLDWQIAEACKFVERNMRVYAVKEPARRDIPQFAVQAFFEALVNAVAHRDYSIQGSKIRLHLFADRLELFSPGTIPKTMTIESIALRQSTRNELLTSLLARCPVAGLTAQGIRTFLMDKRGEGVPIILIESEKLSGRRPEYRVLDDSELMLTIFAATPPWKVDLLSVKRGRMSIEKSLFTMTGCSDSIYFATSAVSLARIFDPSGVFLGQWNGCKLEEEQYDHDRKETGTHSHPSPT